MNITTVQTVYFDKTAIRPRPYKVGRINIGAGEQSGRAYFKYELPARIYTSLTTVMKTCTPMAYGLWQWWMKHGEKEAGRLLKVAANYGTLMHREIGDFCIMQEFNFDNTKAIVDDYLSEIEFYDPDTKDWPERLKEDMHAWATFVHEKNVKVMAVEMVLCSDAYEFATAIDIVCEMDITNKRPTLPGEKDRDGKKITTKYVVEHVRDKAIINMKSGRHGFYAENANQLELERMVWNENYPDVPINYVFNWSPTDWRNADGDKYNLKNQTGKANKVELEAMLMLASERYKGKHERATWTNIVGKVYYGNEPMSNIVQGNMLWMLEKRIREHLKMPEL